MSESIWKDACGLSANTVPFSVRDFGILRLSYPRGILEPVSCGYMSKDSQSCPGCFPVLANGGLAKNAVLIFSHVAGNVEDGDWHYHFNI